MTGFNLPQLRAAPWYPGQMGVPGSDVQRGLRTESAALVLYVDDEYPTATDAADGTDPENPKATIQGAIDQLTAWQTTLATDLDGSVIVVAAEATPTENVTIPATAPKNCYILGAGVKEHAPTWTALVTTAPCLDVQREGWIIEGFTFNCPADAAGIRLYDDNADASSYKTTIRNCIFDGLWGGHYGIEFYGAPHRAIIEGCQFIELQHVDGSSHAIIVANTAVGPGDPYQCIVRNNLFWENDNHVAGLAHIRGFNLSVFTGNIFHEGEINLATEKLDLRGGSRGHNIVTQNVFCGTYSQAAGYRAHAGTPGMWVGNIAEDVASLQVADNGFTVAVPV